MDELLYLMIPLTPLVVAAATGVAGQGLGTLGTGASFPRLGAGDIGSAASIIRGLLRRGLTPRTSTGPFGNLVVGTEGQDLDLLGAQAALRRLNNEVLAELLQEDPLLFIRNLPVGDPRRVAVGLDAPGSAGHIPPSPSAPASPLGQARSLPVTAATARRAGITGSPFFTRNLGRFAVR